MSKIFFALLSLLPVLAVAQNDWSKPCLDGWCSYDVPASETSMAGSIQISGSTSSISDITPAAGWEILNCTADADAQDIRLVCSGDEESCSHLFNNGAEHTIVRLPSGCGSVPFAHVTYCAESEDQSMPEHIKSRIMRRDGSTPPVHSLSFNSNFSDASSSQHGDVSMLVFGSTIPGLSGNATITPPGSRRRSRMVNKRGLFDSVFGLDDFNKTLQSGQKPVDIEKSFNIFNKTISCSENEQAKLSVDVKAGVNAEVSLGVIVAGTILPPNVKDFVLFSDVSADLEGGLSIGANIAGEFDTGKVTLFSQAIPGFEIPKIITLGPSLDIDAQAKATIDLDVTLDVDLTYGFSNLQLFFPPSSDHPSGVNVAPKDTPLKLSASPSVQSNATLEAHLMPTLKFGLDVLDGKAQADIFLDLDTFAALDLGLDAEATGSIDTNGATDASAHVGGCVDIRGGVSVNAGADGSFFGLFDANTQIKLFSKDFDFFKKCFEDSTSGSSSSSSATPSSSLPSSAATGVTPSAPGNVTTSGTSSVISGLVTAQPSASAILSSVSIDPSASVSVSAPPSSSYVSSSTPANSASPLSSSSSVVPSVSNESPGPSNTSTVSVEPYPSQTSTPRISGRGNGAGNNIRNQKVSGQVVKRDLQCLPADVSAAVPVVNQTVSGSSIA